MLETAAENHLADVDDLAPEPGETPLAKAQLAFYGLLVFNVVGAASSVFGGDFPPLTATSALTALGALTGWLTIGWRRGSFPAWGWLVDAGLLAAYVAVTGGQGLSLGLAFPIIMFGALYGPRLSSWGRPAAFSSVYVASAFVQSDGSMAEALALSAVIIVGMLFTSQVIHFLRGTLVEAERNATIAAQNLQRMQQLEQMKNAFLSATSHELRTPVTVIQGLAEVVARRSDQLSSAELQSLLDRLDANSRRLSGLLDDLLDVDRLTRSEITVDRATIDATRLVEETVAGMDTEERPVALPRVTATVDADRVMLERIVENLVRNAVKYTPAGAPIRIDLIEEEAGLVLAVEDEGSGIDPAHRASIFEPFHRLDHDHPSPGTGIGLSLVARFAAAHDGQAWVEDAPGGGSRFCVLIGRGDRPDAPSAEGDVDQPLQHPTKRRRARRHRQPRERAA